MKYVYSGISSVSESFSFMRFFRRLQGNITVCLFLLLNLPFSLKALSIFRNASDHYDIRSLQFSYESMTVKADEREDGVLCSSSNAPGRYLNESTIDEIV